MYNKNFDTNRTTILKEFAEETRDLHTRVSPGDYNLQLVKTWFFILIKHKAITREGYNELAKKSPELSFPIME